MLSIVFMNKRSILTAVLALGLGVTALTGCATDSDSAHSYVTPKDVKTVERPNIGDLIADGKIAVIINTPYGPGSRGDGYLLRTEAVRRGVTCVTAMSAANTYVSAIEAVREDQQGHGSANDMGMDVIALQDLPQYTV